MEIELSMAQTVKHQIELIGEDPNREGLLDTPKRVEKAWREIYSGYNMDEKEILKTQFNEKADNSVVSLKHIEFYSMCEHHLLPFFGEISIGYIPKKKVVGVSKLARLVDCYSKRMQIQEKLVNQIAKAIEIELECDSVVVYCKAKHLCMTMRGVKKQNAEMETIYTSGKFNRQKYLNKFLNS